ncbi:hypothetical protein HDU93_002784 [Gonapodya sp. JEL0774]|nr:hypothetical protein HDU93_002784 [Gonapodya sp. JEL0774]
MTIPYHAKSEAADVATSELGGKGGLEGKIAIVTGSTSGIGQETARVLASHGAHVIVAARSAQKVEDTVAEINRDMAASGGLGKAEGMLVDLGDLTSVRQFTKEFKAKFNSLHLLINNAGIMALPNRELTKDGFEAQFGTNHIGHFVLTNELVPLLVSSAPSRVVCLSSIAHRRSGILWDDVQLEKNYERWLSYGQAKSANILFARELNRQLQPKGVTAVSVHPGGIMTGLQVNIPKAEMEAMGWITADGKLHPMFKTISQGASTTIFGALSKDLAGNGGAYLEDCHVSETQPAERNNEEDAIRLWKVTNEIVGTNYNFEGQQKLTLIIRSVEDLDTRGKAPSVLLPLLLFLKVLLPDGETAESYSGGGLSKSGCAPIAPNDSNVEVLDMDAIESYDMCRERAPADDVSKMLTRSGISVKLGEVGEVGEVGIERERAPKLNPGCSDEGDEGSWYAKLSGAVLSVAVAGDGATSVISTSLVELRTRTGTWGHRVDFDAVVERGISQAMVISGPHPKLLVKLSFSENEWLLTTVDQKLAGTMGSIGT